MTTSFFIELNKLKNAQQHLEKTNTFWNHISRYNQDVDLLDEFITLDKKRKDQANQRYNEVKDIWTLLQNTKKCLQNNDVRELDLRQFKRDMIAIQEKIHQFKAQTLIEENALRNEEKTISEINEAFAQKLCEWDAPPAPKKNYVLSKNSKLIENTNHQDVQQFLNFVQESHGHENGWSSEDHQLFLRMRRKYRNIEDLAKNLNKLLPDIAVAEIISHETWYKKYTELKTKKDRALHEWRKHKNEIKESQTIPEEEKINTKVNIRNNDDIRLKLEQWKAEKETKRQNIILCEQFRKKQQKHLEEEKLKLNLQTKENVAKWKLKRTEQKREEDFWKTMQIEQERKFRSAMANKMIKYFQSQDDLILSKIKAHKIREENQNKKRIKSSCVVERDPERILKPTKQWIMRTNKNDTNENSNFISNIRVIPKLKIPDWRRE